MDASSSANAHRIDQDRVASGTSTPRGDVPRSSLQATALQRATRHKEKFLSMKEKYEQATADHERLKKELSIANDKLKHLQNECNLLLDAVDIAVPGQPTLMHYLHLDPVPEQYTIKPAPTYPEMPVPAPAEVRSSGQTNGTNGHLSPPA